VHGDDRGRNRGALLRKDCYETYWVVEHQIYAFVSGFALLFYIPISIYMRLLWQEMQYDLNVITRPLFFMVKSVFHVILVITTKTLEHYNHLAQSVIYFLIVIAYTGFSFMRAPYNYNRFN
jgi:hypothetical protein